MTKTIKYKDRRQENKICVSFVFRFCCTAAIVWHCILTAFRPAAALGIDKFQNEHLEFDLFYKGLNSAKSEMRLQANDSTTSIVWTVKSKPLVTLLFKIDNRYKAILDKKGRLVRTNKIVEQKNIQQQWGIDYDWSCMRARSSTNFTWPILTDCQNLLFLLYDLRTKSLSPGDTLNYILDVESQLWRATGAVSRLQNDTGHIISDEIAFHFSPAMKIQRRAWKTDLLTNRLARRHSLLTIQLGPPPKRAPLLIRFGGKGGVVEMKLKQ